MDRLQMMDYKNLSELFLDLCPSFKGKSYRNPVIRFKWDTSIVPFMESISQTRCNKRLKAYLIPGELQEGKTSLRFGNKKVGSGYLGKPGSFCLLAASYRDGNLHVFYRRLELIAGLHFDTAIFREVERTLGPIKTITIMAAQADVYALNSENGEKLRLYNQIRDYHLAQ